jgi:predicted metal-binding transcription factor (methanogenesis marker protein 9)
MMFFLLVIVGHKTSLVVGENWCFVSDLYDVNNQPTVELRCTLRAGRYSSISPEEYIVLKVTEIG